MQRVKEHSKNYGSSIIFNQLHKPTTLEMFLLLSHDIMPRRVMFEEKRWEIKKYIFEISKVKGHTLLIFTITFILHII